MQEAMTDDRIAAVLEQLNLEFEAKDNEGHTYYSFTRDGRACHIHLDAAADMLHTWTYFPMAFRGEQVEAAIAAANYINVHQLAPKAVIYRKPETDISHIRFDNIISVAPGISDEQLIDFLNTAAVGDEEATQILNEGLQADE